MNKLEDEISDVLGKAIRGLGRDLSLLCEETGLDEASVQQVLDGGFDEQVIGKLAVALGLDVESLLRLPVYEPESSGLPGVKRLVMPFRNWTVNAWLLEVEGVSLLFDTGWNRTDIITALDGKRPDAVFVTHAHEDHVGGVVSLDALGVKVISEVEALQAGEYRFGKVVVRVMDLSGHCVPTAGYWITGLDKPLWVVGDAIFAGSMGGCKSPETFKMAVASLREGFQMAEAGCLILPGHGPLTSVASERESNPFRTFFS